MTPAERKIHERLVARLDAMQRRWSLPTVSRFRPPPGGDGDAIRWGKLTAAWTTGNTVTLTPCASQTDGTATGEPNVTCYLFSPSTAAPCGVYLASGDIIGYFPLPNDEGIATAVRFRNSLVIRGTATKTSGVDGSFTTSATCAYVYTIADLDGNTLGTGKSPDRVRIPNCTYTVPSGAQPALLYQLADGTWGLIDVLTERPATATMTVHVNPVWNGTKMAIDFDSWNVLLLDKKDNETKQSVLFYNCAGARPS